MEELLTEQQRKDFKIFCELLLKDDAQNKKMDDVQENVLSILGLNDSPENLVELTKKEVYEDATKKYIEAVLANVKESLKYKTKHNFGEDISKEFVLYLFYCGIGNVVNDYSFTKFYTKLAKQESITEDLVKKFLPKRMFVSKFKRGYNYFEFKLGNVDATMYNKLVTNSQIVFSQFKNYFWDVSYALKHEDGSLVVELSLEDWELNMLNMVNNYVPQLNSAEVILGKKSLYEKGVINIFEESLTKVDTDIKFAKEFNINLVMQLAMTHLPKDLNITIIDDKKLEEYDDLSRLKNVRSIIGEKYIENELNQLMFKQHMREKLFRELGVKNYNEYVDAVISGKIEDKHLPREVYILNFDLSQLAEDMTFLFKNDDKYEDPNGWHKSTIPNFKETGDGFSRIWGTDDAIDVYPTTISRAEDGDVQLLSYKISESYVKDLKTLFESLYKYGIHLVINGDFPISVFDIPYSLIVREVSNKENKVAVEGSTLNTDILYLNNVPKQTYTGDIKNFRKVLFEIEEVQQEF